MAVRSCLISHSPAVTLLWPRGGRLFSLVDVLLLLFIALMF